MRSLTVSELVSDLVDPFVDSFVSISVSSFIDHFAVDIMMIDSFLLIQDLVICRSKDRSTEALNRTRRKEIFESFTHRELSQFEYMKKKLTRTRNKKLNFDVNRAIRRVDVNRRNELDSRERRDSRNESDSRNELGSRNEFDSRSGLDSRDERDEQEDENESIIYESDEIVKKLQMSNKLYATFQL